MSQKDRHLSEERIAAEVEMARQAKKQGKGKEFAQAEVAARVASGEKMHSLKELRLRDARRTHRRMHKAQTTDSNQ